MRRLICSSLILPVLIALGCATSPGQTSGESDKPVEKKYADLELLVRDMDRVMDTFEKEFEAAAAENDGPGVALALEQMFGELGGFISRQKVIIEKYPELTEDNPSPELKELQQGMADFNTRLIMAISSASEYRDDPAVMNALSQMSTILQENS